MVKERQRAQTLPLNLSSGACEAGELIAFTLGSPFPSSKMGSIGRGPASRGKVNGKAIQPCSGVSSALRVLILPVVPGKAGQWSNEELCSLPSFGPYEQDDVGTFPGSSEAPALWSSNAGAEQLPFTICYRSSPQERFPAGAVAPR